MTLVRVTENSTNARWETNKEGACYRMMAPVQLGGPSVDVDMSLPAHGTISLPTKVI